MTGQPSRVSPAEISALLDTARTLHAAAPLAEQLAYHERKARLLSRVAADLDTADAHLAAAEAWHQCRDLAARQYNSSTEVAR